MIQKQSPTESKERIHIMSADYNFTNRETRGQQHFTFFSYCYVDHLEEWINIFWKCIAIYLPFSRAR